MEFDGSKNLVATDIMKLDEFIGEIFISKIEEIEVELVGVEEEFVLFQVLNESSKDHESLIINMPIDEFKIKYELA